MTVARQLLLDEQIRAAQQGDGAQLGGGFDRRGDSLAHYTSIFISLIFHDVTIIFDVNYEHKKKATPASRSGLQGKGLRLSARGARGGRDGPEARRP